MTTPPHQSHSETSRAAATAIAPSADALRQRVFEFIKGRGEMGATDEEIQRELAIPGNTQRPRRRELQQQQRIKDSGWMRPTTSGRSATIWVVA